MSRTPRMATSTVMASSSSANSDLARQSPLYATPAAELQNSATGGDLAKGVGSMSMEDLLRNIYGDNASSMAVDSDVGGGDVPTTPEKTVGVKTAEEVWREITAGRLADGAGGVAPGASESDSKAAVEMTLEDYLTKAGTMMEEDVRVPTGVFPADLAATDRFGHQPQQQPPLTIDNPVLGFGNGMDVVGLGMGRGGRGRRRPLLDPVDKAALQRQKRMIKNRESAARSRERKQAYTTELESLVHRLEQENHQLLADLEEQNKERLKQLMEKVIPVSLQKKPQRKLRRASSMDW
ncbi:G-box-binding factor 4 [Apostasia shenzhenica]|uniref:G-box-binding factor 4 n=1 Tax=Apostasia shenzhenica TaxID=1088818 RepID=A0A2I0A829_9ASPA|nr:G-box-binding factor 4 [Apostasia shenzhenica]